MPIVGKSDVWAYKNIILYRDAIPNHRPVFNRNPIPDNDLALNKDMGAYVAVFTNRRAIQYDNILPYSGASPNFAVADTGCWVNEIRVTHFQTS